MANNVDPDQTGPIKSSLFWVHVVCFYTQFVSNVNNYMQQTTLADDISIDQFYSSLASGDCCRLLICFFANNFDLSKVLTKRRPLSGSKPFATLIVFLMEFYTKVNFEKKNQQTSKKHRKLPNMLRV